MNLDQLINECRYRTGFNDSSYNPQWISFINEAVSVYATKWPWPGHEELIQLTSDGTRFLIFPEYVDQIISILNRSQGIAVERSADFDRTNPYVHSNRTTGTVINYEPVGMVPILREPTGYLFAYSTSASDISDPLLNVSGYVAASGASGTGLERVYSVEQIYLTGSSAVTLSAQFVNVTSISKSASTYGDIFLFDAGDSNKHISHIPRYESSAAFKRVLLQYAPSAQTLFECRIRHKIRPLQTGTQSPHPSVDDKFLISYAISRFWKAQHQYSKSQIDRAEALERIQDRANVEENFNENCSRIIPDYPYDDYGLRDNVYY